MINEDFPFNSLRGNIEKHNPIEVDERGFGEKQL